MRFWVSVVLLAFIALRAMRSGGAPEKYAAATFSIAFALELMINLIAGPPDFSTVNWFRLGLDLGVFACLLWIALRANRWWPISICALQVIVIAGHLSALMKLNAIVGVYWGMTVIPFYLEYLVLLVGIVAHSRREARFGSYPDWTRFQKVG